MLSSFSRLCTFCCFRPPAGPFHISCCCDARRSGAVTKSMQFNPLSTSFIHYTLCSALLRTSSCRKVHCLKLSIAQASKGKPLGFGSSGRIYIRIHAIHTTVLGVSGAIWENQPEPSETKNLKPARAARLDKGPAQGHSSPGFLMLSFWRCRFRGAWHRSFVEFQGIVELG